MKYCIILTFIILLITSLALAQPTITGVGALNHGESCIITGNSFGTKSTAAPQRFEQWEDEGASDGDSLADNGYWTVGGEGSGYLDRAVYDDGFNRHSRSTFSGYFDIDMVGSTKSQAKIQKNGSILSTSKWFVSLWVYIDFIQMGGQRQYKTWRFTTDGSYSPGGPAFRNTSHANATNDGFANLYMEHDPNLSGHIWWDAHPVLGDTCADGRIDENCWIYMEYQYKAGTAGVADGEIHWWISDCTNGDIMYDTTNNPVTNRSSGETEYIRGLQFNTGVANLNSNDSMDAWYDDIYIDDTWQRVVLGDDSDYDSCTHREMQPPTSWSNTSIAITVNQGSFADDDNVYVFVIDEDGEPNAVGYGPLSFTGLRAQSGVVIKSGGMMK